MLEIPSTSDLESTTYHLGFRGDDLRNLHDAGSGIEGRTLSVLDSHTLISPNAESAWFKDVWGRSVQLG